jgi:UDPglucose--hexose-1-phosphate uridylyltransferase
MSNQNADRQPHRRYNVLTGEWVLVSPQRTQRPWLGKTETLPGTDRSRHDPSCYLCPGNLRANGVSNPSYDHVYVFPNDFSALIPDGGISTSTSTALLQRESVKGECRVICFSPRHDMTLAEMDRPGIRAVVDCWADQVADLGRTYRWVQVFENKGDVMGCSNPHPHGQVWAGSFIPNEPAKEDQQQRLYYRLHRSPLLFDVMLKELAANERVVVQNGSWVAIVPFWAVWPYELLLLPRRHIQLLPDCTERERDELADILKRLLTRYDNLFETPFPYSMGWHGAPTDGNDHPHWQLHAHFYPPLLRSATVKKFMVGYEMMAEAQRDLTAEQAAERLRALPEKHYKEGSTL